MGAKKKEIKVVTPSEANQSQSVEKVYVPQSDKQTVMIEGSVEQIVGKLVETFRNEIKVL
jgi:electron transfer flavoprotein alpha/beta subunit